MKQTFALLTAPLFLLLCSCTVNTSLTVPETESPQTVSVIMPDEETAATVNGYLIEDCTSAESDSARTGSVETYFANSSSKKFHNSTCYHSKRIKEENMIVTDDRDYLISNGYEPCKTCKP